MLCVVVVFPLCIDCGVLFVRGCRSLLCFVFLFVVVGVCCLLLVVCRPMVVCCVWFVDCMPTVVCCMLFVVAVARCAMFECLVGVRWFVLLFGDVYYLLLFVCCALSAVRC